MNIFFILLAIFFIIIIIFPFFSYSSFIPFFNKEGLTPLDDEYNNNNCPISLSDLEKEVDDISGNVVDLKKTVDQLIASQAEYLSKNPLPEANISVSSVS